jgi:hypothetical protein
MKLKDFQDVNINRSDLVSVISFDPSGEFGGTFFILPEDWNVIKAGLMTEEDFKKTETCRFTVQNTLSESERQVTTNTAINVIEAAAEVEHKVLIQKDEKKFEAAGKKIAEASAQVADIVDLKVPMSQATALALEAELTKFSQASIETAINQVVRAGEAYPKEDIEGHHSLQVAKLSARVAKSEPKTPAELLYGGGDPGKWYGKLVREEVLEEGNDQYSGLCSQMHQALKGYALQVQDLAERAKVNSVAVPYINAGGIRYLIESGFVPAVDPIPTAWTAEAIARFGVMTLINAMLGRSAMQVPGHYFNNPGNLNEVGWKRYSENQPRGFGVGLMASSYGQIGAILGSIPELVDPNYTRIRSILRGIHYPVVPPAEEGGQEVPVVFNEQNMEDASRVNNGVANVTRPQRILGIVQTASKKPTGKVFKEQPNPIGAKPLTKDEKDFLTDVSARITQIKGTQPPEGFHSTLRSQLIHVPPKYRQTTMDKITMTIDNAEDNYAIWKKRIAKEFDLGLPEEENPE